MNTKHKKGMVAECYAKAWLLENFNCMIYTPENGLGPIDIIARYKDGSVRYFDVKSVSRRNDKNKSLINRGSKDKKIEIMYVNLKTKEVRIKKTRVKKRNPMTCITKYKNVSLPNGSGKSIEKLLTLYNGNNS